MSNTRVRVRIYSDNETEGIIYSISLCETIRTNGEYSHRVLFTNQNLTQRLNSGWRIDWIQILGYSNYVRWRADYLFLNYFSARVIYEPPTPPRAPVLSLESDQFESNVQLAWTQPSSSAPISGYRIYRNGTLLATTTSRTYTDNSPKSFGQQLHYTVMAVSAIGESQHSNAVHVFICTRPDPPVLTSIAQNHSGIAIAWNAPADGGSTIEHYRIYCAINNSTFSNSANTSATHRSFIVSALPNTRYSFRISAVNARGESDLSNELTIQSAQWGVAVSVISPSWITGGARYTAADTATVAFDVQPDYYNTTIHQLAIELNGTRPNYSIINSTRATMRIPLVSGINRLNIEYSAYNQSITDTIEITRTESIRGAVYLDPQPIQFESIRILTTKNAQIRISVSNLADRIRRDSSYIRIQSGYNRINILSVILEQPHSINTSIDISQYLSIAGLNSISISLEFYDGTAFADYVEFFVDNDAPIIKDGILRENLTVLEFEITEEFPATLELHFTAKNRNPLILRLDTNKQFGLYSGFNNYVYSIQLNDTLLEYSAVTVVCVDGANRTTELRIQLSATESTIVDLPPQLVIAGGLIAGLATLISIARSKIKNKTLLAGVEKAREVTDFIQQGLNNVTQASTSIQTLAQTHATEELSKERHQAKTQPQPQPQPQTKPHQLRMSNEEILAKIPERIGALEFITRAYFIANGVSFDRVRELYEQALPIARQKNYTVAQFWVVFCRLVLREEQK